MKRKIIISIFALLLAVGIAGTFWGTDIVQAATNWNSCPKGKVNDYKPGDCHLYVDTNKDNICDLSQSAPAIVTSTIKPATTTSNVATVTPSSGSLVISSVGDAGATNTGTSIKSGSYYFVPIAVVCLVLYCATWLLVFTKKIKPVIHRYIWNNILLVAMIGSTLLGLERILVIDYNLIVPLPFNALFWHVEISIVLGVVGVIHILWHWRYFTKMLGTQAKPES